MNYILKTLLTEGLGLNFNFVNDVEVFKKSDHIKINYSDLIIENCFHIKPHTILFDHGIRDYHLEVTGHAQYYKIFMKSAGSSMPFDFFGAAFWLLTRYEEHLPFKADAHNRFNYRSSLAYQYEFIQFPIINLWLNEFKNLLLQQFPILLFKTQQYNYLSTIDVDNAYKYKYKGFVRTIAGIVSDRSLNKIKERFKIILGQKSDPFDCYDFLIRTHGEQDVKALFFILLGDYGPNDKNHSASDLRFQSLIKHLKDYAMVGIHPSYGSNKNLRQLKVEVNRLNNITHTIVTQSRQHFSMLKFPATYQNLLQAGIFADYSMGYTNYNGFRASYCYPFKWYSLDIEASSALTIYPFCISENTLLSNSKKNYTQMLEGAKLIIDEVKKYQGHCISIFHNDNFNPELEKFYMEFLKLAKDI